MGSWAAEAFRAVLGLNACRRAGKIERWQRRLTFFGLSKGSAESWTQLRIDGALQLSWDRRSQTLRGEFWTGG
jgi:hypothetical protein